MHLHHERRPSPPSSKMIFDSEAMAYFVYTSDLCCSTCKQSLSQQYLHTESCGYQLIEVISIFTSIFMSLQYGLSIYVDFLLHFKLLDFKFWIIIRCIMMPTSSSVQGECTINAFLWRFETPSLTFSFSFPGSASLSTMRFIENITPSVMIPNIPFEKGWRSL